MGALNEQVNNTLMRSYKRAENPDESLLADTFVAIPQLHNLLRSPEHQILYGRRGTGKTHVLRYLAQQKRAEGATAIYVDLRTIGSSAGIYADNNLSLPTRATTLLVDVVNAVHAEIYDLILSGESYKVHLEALGPALDRFAESVSEIVVRGSVETETSETKSHEAGREGDTGLKIGRSIEGSYSRSRRQSDKSESGSRRTERGEEAYHLVFGRLALAIKELVRSLGGDGLWLMFDEWSSLPLELQPFLADLIRRNLFNTVGVTVKIGAIERRSNFMNAASSGNYLGIELGSDTAASLDIDDYLTFENDRSEVQTFFANVLYRHVASFQELQGEAPLFPEAADFLRIAFAKPTAFARLIEASEGVPRDALQIAALSASLAATGAITDSHVRRASSDYFRRDKEGRISEVAFSALNEIIDHCVKNESRIIALRRPIQSSKAAVAELYDARLLHRRAQRMHLPEKPYTEKYDLFLVDLGCFADLIQAGKVRMVDEGGRAVGIVSTNGSDHSLTASKSSFTLVPGADRWK